MVTTSMGVGGGVGFAVVYISAICTIPRTRIAPAIILSITML